MHYSKEIGMRIKKRRLSMGYTQKDLIDIIAKELNDDEKLISEKQLSRIECGTSGTTLENFCLIFKALEKTPNYFMLGISDDSSSEAKQLIRLIDEHLKECREEKLKIILLLVKTLAYTEE